jgi:hypothetical protein
MEHDSQHCAIELHDSEVERFEARPRVLSVRFSHAYIHCSDGEPGVAPGTGWSQRAVLAISDAELVGAEPTVPAEVAEGELRAAGAVYSNSIPAPFQCHGPVKLTLSFTSGESLTVSGSGAALELLGERRFIERFPGA